MISPQPKIAVILPAYNEEQTIVATIQAFHKELPNARIVVVNNNSSDKTGQLATQTLRELNILGEVINEPRQGKGNAVRRAFLEVDADAYILSDADQTYPAHQVHELLSPVLSGEADMVVGDRHSNGRYASENKRPLHNLGNNLVQILVNKLFGAKLVDIMSGYRVFSRSFVKTYPILVEGFQIETDMTLHALHRRMRVLEIPVEYKDRPSGSVSKLNTFSDGARVIFTIAQILRYYRPLAFFLAFAALFFFAGLIAAIPVLNDWFTTKYITHVPLAILAAALETIAIMLLAIGIVLDSISHHEKKRAELHYLATYYRYKGSHASTAMENDKPENATTSS